MKIITVSHQKGGVGKTTLALNLAAAFRNGGLNVGILDTDVQGSLTGISDQLEGLNFVPAEQLGNIGSLTYDILIIDTPPYLMDTLADLFSISDYILVPSKTGFFDVLAIRATLGIIRKVQEEHPNLKYGVVLNMLKSSTSLTEDIVGILEGYEANILNTRIYDRVAYMRSSITNGVFSTDDTKAHNEILSLTEEILAAL
jgi:chromosome partitioning protein